jgi:hypothetical protein
MEASATDKPTGTIPGPNAGTPNANQSTAARQG